MNQSNSNKNNNNNNKNISNSSYNRDDGANNNNLVAASNISADREVARGLVNLGNTCYANAVLQSLAHAPEWCNAMELTPHHAVCRLNSLGRKLEQNKQGGEDEEVEPFCLLCEVENIISSLHSTPCRDVTAISASANNTISPTRFMENFTSTVAPWFRKGLQEDSHEFLRLLTDAMQRASITNSCYTAITNDDNNVYSDYPIQLFRGQIQSTVTCLACHQISTTVEPMEDIGLECIYYSQQPTTSNIAHHKLASIQQSLNKLIQQEALECYKCERCHTVGKATKQSKIQEIPPLLTLHLKRFRYGTVTTTPTPTLSAYNRSSTTADASTSASTSNGFNTFNSSNSTATTATTTTTNSIASSTTNYTMTNMSIASAGRTGSKKIEGYIKFDELLDLQPYCTDNWQYSFFGSSTGTIERSDGTTTTPTSNKKRSCYCRLFAVVVHTGSSSHSGHYYALVRNLKKNEWWKMDDGNSVRLASSNEVTNAHAYMLFYRSVEHPISIQLRDGVLRKRNQQKQQQQQQQQEEEEDEEKERKKKQNLEQIKTQKPSNTATATTTTTTAAMSIHDTQVKRNSTPTKIEAPSNSNTMEFNKVQGSLKQDNIQTTATVFGDEEMSGGTLALGKEEAVSDRWKMMSDGVLNAKKLDGVTAAATNGNAKRKDITNTTNRHTDMTLEEWIVQPKKKWPRLSSITTTSSNTDSIIPLLQQAQAWVSEKVQLNADYFHKLTEDSKVSENFVFQDDILQQVVSNNGCQSIKTCIKYLLRKLLTPIPPKATATAIATRQLNDEEKRKQRQLLMAQAVVVDDIPVSPVSNASNSSLSLFGRDDDLLVAEPIISSPGSKAESVVAAAVGGSMIQSSNRR